MQSEITGYQTRHDEFLAELEKDSLMIKSALDWKPDEIKIDVQESKPIQPVRLFKPAKSLEPPFLEKGASSLEVKHFVELFANFIYDGFGGREHVVNSLIPPQLMVLVEQYWRSLTFQH